MAGSDASGMPIFHGSDPVDIGTNLNLISSATGSIFNGMVKPTLVANDTAKNALGNQKNPSIDNPLLVWIQSSGKFQFNSGTGWRDWPDFQDIANMPTQVIAGPNELIIGGKTYQASGIWNVTTSQIVRYTNVKQSGVYLFNIVRELPAAPPSGWTVEAVLVNNGARYGSLSIGARSGTTVTMRYMQYYNTSKVAMKIGWRLVKDS